VVATKCRRCLSVKEFFVTAHAHNYEELIEVLVMRICVDERTALVALQDVFGLYPDADLDAVILAATMAASGIEEWYSEGPALLAATDLWRLTSVLSCEAIHLRRATGKVPLVSDAVLHWMLTGDQLFLRGV
jgi:hypothetical protein